MKTTGLRVTSTDNLRTLWRKAGPGKRPSAEFMETLDEQGLHTVRVVAPFTGTDASEHRVEGYAVVVGSDLPHLYQMDMLAEDFNRLEPLETLMERLDATSEPGEGCPDCKSDSIIEDGDLLVCAECGWWA